MLENKNSSNEKIGIKSLHERIAKQDQIIVELKKKFEEIDKRIDKNKSMIEEILNN